MVNNEIYDYVKGLCIKAGAAKTELANANGKIRNSLVLKIAEGLEKNTDIISSANKEDIASAKESGIKESLVDRLVLDEKRIFALVASLRELASLPDPIGSGDITTRPNGLVIEHIRVPLGVVAAIYEARPNVTADIAALCLKTGNAAVLRGGREAKNTNTAIVEIIKTCLSEAGLSPDCVSLINDTDRDGAQALMQMRGFIDLLIPRGGRHLIKSVAEGSTVPVIETGAGVCHTLADESCDMAMAAEIIKNAKLSRPSVCNAMESLLVHKNIAKSFLPLLFDEINKEHTVEFRCCPVSYEILAEKGVKRASEEDFDTEYNDYILSVKVVDSLDEAINHINTHGTHHSDAIVTKSMENADEFTRRVDSAAVYVNASTRFTDGGEFGLGAEVGISTQKLHARGPMGLCALTTEKFVVRGFGQVR
jgi:glutamate-5-semialdehyde dehydrogenase